MMNPIYLQQYLFWKLIITAVKKLFPTVNLLQVYLKIYILNTWRTPTCKIRVDFKITQD